MLSFQISRPVVLMDICTISYIKDRKKIKGGQDQRKQERLRQLKVLVDRGYRFSFLLAILEKGTNRNHPLNCDQLLERFKRDYDLIVDFIGKNNIVESIQALDQLIPIFMDETYSKDERAELSIPSSIKLLEFYNDMKISSTPSAKERFDLAVKITTEGKTLGLVKGYPPISICVSAIYGCEDARKVLKIKKDGSKFNPSNCLGDIMSFYRVAEATYRIKEFLPDAKVIYRTEDEALENLHKYLITTVKSKIDNTSAMNIICTNPEKLFPTLFKNEKCINQTELDSIYELLDFKVN
ncbi:hypothetical protein AB6F55_19460 [Providencia hangzhouensis]